MSGFVGPPCTYNIAFLAEVNICLWRPFSGRLFIPYFQTAGQKNKVQYGAYEQKLILHTQTNRRTDGRTSGVMRHNSLRRKLGTVDVPRIAVGYC